MHWLTRVTACNKSGGAVTADDMSLGNPNAKVTVIEYASASCVHCARWNEEVAPEYPLTEEGKAAPLLRQNLRAELPEGVTLPLLGDLVICAPVVAKEALEQGKPLNAHYAHLTIHGVLHLLGLDHEDEREAEAMEQIERDILATLGLPDPY